MGKISSNNKERSLELDPLEYNRFGIRDTTVGQIRSEVLSGSRLAYLAGNGSARIPNRDRSVKEQLDCMSVPEESEKSKLMKQVAAALSKQRRVI